MPAVARQGDSCTGHDCFPPRAAAGGSSDVFINGRPALRQGDPWPSHSCGSSCHPGTLAAGSGSVFCNGRALGRLGDPLDCGSAVSAGSPNVFAGG